MNCKIEKKTTFCRHIFGDKLLRLTLYHKLCTLSKQNKSNKYYYIYYVYEKRHIYIVIGLVGQSFFLSVCPSPRQ